MEPLFHLATQCRGGGGQLVVLNLGGEIEGRLVAEAGGLEALLAINVAALGVVAAVQVDDPVLGQLPEPDMKREVGLREVSHQALASFEEHVLHHIAGIDPPGEPPIHPHLDHPPQAMAVPLQEVVDGLRVTGSGLLEQVLGVVKFWPHGVLSEQVH